MKTDSLSHTFRNQWKDFENQFSLSKDRCSRRNIHQLRIATQKLEAVLVLAHSLHADRKINSLTEFAKDIRKSLGPLRDAQVQSLAIENQMAEKSPKLSKFLSARKTKAKKKAIDGLEKISLDSKKKCAKKILKRLEHFEAEFFLDSIQK
jgi:CHAD domain-containing protein